ncbi:MAG: hypothetical protein JWP88_1533 [Flaviaesturariibacter sp.]|nr:hypothetical protein [Flaviaesturariibacter sp.]
MPDFLTILTRWWKPIFGLTAVVAILTAILLAFLPSYYMSMVTALPANSTANDKGSIFNTNIQELYPAIGLPDELDKIVGTASLDTLHIALVNKFNLVDHYNIKRGPHEVFKAVEKLRDNSSVLKSEYGEVKIRVWDQDAQLAADIANQYYEMLQELHQQVQNMGNTVILKKLQDKYKVIKKELTDSQTASSNVNQGDSSLEIAREGKTAAVMNTSMIQQYEQLIAEYSLLIESKPPVLLLVDHARPGYYVDRPRRWPLFCFITFAGFLFGLLLAVSLERRSKA